MYIVKRCYYLYALCTILTCSIFLSGCGVTEKETTAVEDEQKIVPMQADEMEVKSTKVDKQKETSLSIEGENQVDNQIKVGEMENNNNNIYNAVKYYNNYFYFSDVDGFNRMNRDQVTTERIAEGNVKIGNCDNNYIYYIRYASDSVKNPGVFRMDLSRHMEEELMEWSESMWGINNIYAYQNVIYFAENDFCEAYEVIDGNVEEMEVKDNFIYQQLDKCGILHGDINNLLFGYINMIFEYHKLLYWDGNNNKITVYDTESGKIIDVLDQCRSDVLVSDRGIIYRDLDNNILLKKWNADEATILYSMSEYDNRFVNYGTYDEDYIYGFYENGDECTLVKIKWEGGCEIGRTFADVRISVDLSFSANNGVISFLQDGHRVFEKL